MWRLSATKFILPWYIYNTVLHAAWTSQFALNSVANTLYLYRLNQWILWVWPGFVAAVTPVWLEIHCYHSSRFKICLGKIKILISPRRD